MTGCLSDPNQILAKLHVNWGHVSAQQLRRASVDSVGGNTHSVNSLGEALEQGGARRALDTAPRLRVAGISTAPVFNEDLQVEFASLGDIVALRVMGAFPGYAGLKSVWSENPQGA